MTRKGHMKGFKVRIYHPAVLKPSLKCPIQPGEGV
jgi:hypothetical protein